MTGQPHELTALAQAAAVRRRELSSVELVTHYLRRIEALDPRLGAFVTVTPDPALAAARAADGVVAADPAGLPPLHGVPVAIKDLTLTAGVRTTFGSRVFAHFVPSVDADVVTALRQAGTVSLGKTATSELGASLYCETALGPPTRNPWDLSGTSGGSSGGAAAAVAAGLVAAAQGNDGGGSVRIPAAICGLVGFKPSRGVVSNGPLGFDAFGLPTNGPIARTVTDAAALLDAMAAPALGEPYLAPPAPPGGYLAAASAPDPGRLRIGRWTTPVLAEAAPDPVCLAAVELAAAHLAGAGHELVEVPPPVEPVAAPLFETLWRALALATPVPPDQERRLLPVTRWLREQGREVGVGKLLDALARLQAQVRAGARRLAGLDLLLSPTLARPGAPIGWFTGPGDPAEDFARQKELSPYCAVYNLTGQPAVSLPLGTTPAGAPVGVMLAAAPGADGLLLRVAAQLERLAPWAHRHPPLWDAPGADHPERR
jgi:amidase